MKKIAIINMSFLFEIPYDWTEKGSDVIDKDYPIEERFTDHIETQIENLAETLVKPKVSWKSSHSVTYTVGKDNIDQCANCGGWTSDKRGADFIKELGIGTTHDGKLLCDECLPPEHPLAF